MQRTIILRSVILRLAIAAICGVAAAGRPAAAAEIDDVHPDERAAVKALSEFHFGYELNDQGRVVSLGENFSLQEDDEQVSALGLFLFAGAPQFSGVSVTDDALAQIKTLAGLERLVLPGNWGKRILAADGRFAKIFEQQPDDPDSKEDVEHRRSMIEKPQITDQGVANVAGLVRLQDLTLSYTWLTDKGLESLAKLTLLRKLDLNGTEITDAGMPKLLPLVNLASLKLDHTTVGDAGIQKLAGLKQLRHLSLNQTLVSQEGAGRLRAALPELEITPASLPTTAQVEAVRTLRSNGSEVELDDRGRAIQASFSRAYSRTVLLAELRALAALATLEELDLTHNKLTDDDITGHLGPLTRLKSLQIDEPEERFSCLMQVLVDRQKHSLREALAIVGLAEAKTDDAPDPLKLADPFVMENPARYPRLVPSLERLNLNDRGITDARLAQLADLDELRELHLAGNAISDKGIAALGKLTNLEILDLSRTAVTDAGLRLLPTKHLKALRLDHTGVTDAGVLELSARSDLKSLFLRYTQISAEAIEKIAADHPKLTILPDEFPAAAIARQVAEINREGILLGYDGRHNLVEVLFDQTETTDADLEKLVRIPTIKVLHLKGDQVTLAGCKALPQLTNLEELGFRDMPLTDAMTTNLAKLDKLTWLDLTGTKVSDKGTAQLAGLSHLTWIGLGETSITDAGLVPLEKLQNLQEVNLLDTKVTQQGVERLQDALPACRIRASRPSTPE